MLAAPEFWMKPIMFDPKARLIAEIEAGDELGEGIVWDHRTGHFIWTDILGKRLHRWHASSGQLDTHAIPARPASLTLTEETGRIILALDTGLARYDFASSELDWIVRPDLPAGVRFNDGRTGPDGCFWVGTMVEDTDKAGCNSAGTLYRFDSQHALHAALSGIHISNGLCWSPDGRRVYHSDSPLGQVSVYDFDVEAGAISNGRVLADTNPLGGGPDGAVTDAAGRYWSALWGGSCVAVLDSNGTNLARVEIPAPHVTCPCFGGPDMTWLAVTTARAELAPSQLVAAPRSGNVFIYEVDATGMQAFLFGGKA